MADGKKPKKGKSRTKKPEERVTLRIRRELIEKLEALADSEKLGLSDYIHQLLKHQVVANNTQERKCEQFRESQRGGRRPNIRGLPSKAGRIIVSANVLAQPDPFLNPDTDIARALIKRAVRQQALPETWGYGRLRILDREGFSHHVFTTPNYLSPFATEGDAGTRPIWKAFPGKVSDIMMSCIRQAQQGEPAHAFTSLELIGHRLNFEGRVFDVGKGLFACLIKSSWEKASHPVKIPTEFDELSRYYLLKQRLDVIDPQCVWWVRDTGIITNHRTQLAVTPLYPFLQQRVMDVEDVFKTDLVEGIMSRVHTASQTREKQSFTLKETQENLWEWNSYAIYPLNDVWPKERDLVMITKSFMASTILDPQKIYSVG